MSKSSRRSWLVSLLAIAVILLVIGVLSGPRVGAVIQVLTPPDLPPATPVSAQVWTGDQGWDAATAERFHHETQGTHTLPIPLSWLRALEQPASGILGIPFAKKGRFIDNGYIQRFGFIGSAQTPEHPDSLPIGFAVTSYQTIAGLQQKDTAVGLTCAACHTGSLIYKDKRYVFDGAPAATDLGQFTRALGAALGQTALSEKLGPFDSRFERFAKAVLGREYSDATRNKLAADLGSVLTQTAGQPGGIRITEGFHRLDALNRIGNQVFALDPHRYNNYVDINAPVKYPHIWTSSWFKWVQYDGSIMQPLIRNAGEAMGVGAEFVFDAPPGAGRFANSIAIDNLHWIEQALAGPDQPAEKKAFTGLNAPAWPAAFPAIDAAKAAQGAKLYEEICSHCHLTALTPEVAHGRAPASPFWSDKNFQPIHWLQGGKDWTTKEKVLDVNIIPQAEVGTDPAQSQVLLNRMVDTAGTALQRAGEFTPNMGLDIDICLPIDDKNFGTVRVSDNANLNFAQALGGMVQEGINEWFQVTRKDPAQQHEIEGDRPNCLQGGKGYKARPLNGIWAVAPYLHNGSVPTLRDLLGPAKDRPKVFLVGAPEFDPEHVGLKVEKAAATGRPYDGKGSFIFDTSVPGNHNTGHEFADEKRPGVVGRALSEDERSALIEFLKTL